MCCYFSIIEGCRVLKIKTFGEYMLNEYRSIGALHDLLLSLWSRGASLRQGTPRNNRSASEYPRGWYWLPSAFAIKS